MQRLVKRFLITFGIFLFFFFPSFSFSYATDEIYLPGIPSNTGKNGEFVMGAGGLDVEISPVEEAVFYNFFYRSERLREPYAFSGESGWIEESYYHFEAPDFPANWNICILGYSIMTASGEVYDSDEYQLMFIISPPDTTLYVGENGKATVSLRSRAEAELRLIMTGKLQIQKVPLDYNGELSLKDTGWFEVGDLDHCEDDGERYLCVLTDFGYVEGYNIRVRAEDNWGNVSGWNYYIKPPEIKLFKNFCSVVSPLNEDNFCDKDTFEIEVGGNYDSWEFVIDGIGEGDDVNNVWKSVGTDSEVELVPEVSNLTDGTYEARLNLLKNEGVVDTRVISFRVDNTPPVVDWISLNASDSFLYTLAGEVDEDCTVKINGELVDLTDYIFNYDELLISGLNNFIVEVKDKAGNIYTEVFQVDYLSTIAQEIEDVFHEYGEELPSGENVAGESIVIPDVPTIQSPVSGTQSQKTKILVSGSANNSKKVEIDYGKEIVEDNVSLGNFSREIVFPQGLSWIKARGCNLDGCSTWSFPINIFVDSVAPQTPSISFETYGSKLVIKSSGENFSTVDFYNFDNYIGYATVRENGIAEFTVAEDRGYDLYIIRARAHDSIGNFSGWSNEIVYKQDPPPPSSTPAPTPTPTPEPISPVEEVQGEETSIPSVGDIFMEFNVYADGRVKMVNSGLVPLQIIGVTENGNDYKITGVASVKGTLKVNYYELKSKWLGLYVDEILVDSTVVEIDLQNNFVKDGDLVFSINADGRFEFSVPKSGASGVISHNTYGYFIVSKWGKNFELHYNLTGDEVSYERSNGVDIPDFFPIETDDIACPGVHNSAKKYSIGESALLLSELLAKNSRGWYAKFKCVDPYCDYIPTKVKDVYNLAGNVWKPINGNETYVQCIAFAYMSYNLADNPIRKVSGNAITFAGKDWSCYSYNSEGVCVDWRLINNSVYADQFTVYESGVSDVMPEIGDLMVWQDSAPYGHVGVVVNIDRVRRKITVFNSNSPSTKYDFEYEQAENNELIIKGGSWKPRWWARKR